MLRISRHDVHVGRPAGRVLGTPQGLRFFLQSVLTFQWFCCSISPGLDIAVGAARDSSMQQSSPPILEPECNIEASFWLLVVVSFTAIESLPFLYRHSVVSGLRSVPVSKTE